MSDEAPPGATHRHFKGGWYRYVGLAKHSETSREFVVYEHLSPHQRQMWVRPSEEFHDKVYGKPRFAEIPREPRREPVPASPGFYWAKWKHPAEGSQTYVHHEGRNERWEVVEVSQGDDVLIVDVAGESKTQVLEDFFWGAGPLESPK